MNPREFFNDLINQHGLGDFAKTMFDRTNDEINKLKVWGFLPEITEDQQYTLCYNLTLISADIIVEGKIIPDLEEDSSNQQSHE